MKNKERNNAVICPSCGEQPSAPEGFNPGVALATKRGLFNKVAFLTTPHRPFGALPPQVGKLTISGFTLIELLVVVLIIGILAAVAVPQYQTAVDKARLANYLPVINNIKKAQEVYYLANENYTRQLTDLDIDTTKICPTLYDGGNELLNCKGGFKIDNCWMNGESCGIILDYCPGKNHTTGPTCRKSDNMIATIWLAYPHQANYNVCLYRDNRGKRLCEYAKSIFGVDSSAYQPGIW